MPEPTLRASPGASSGRRCRVADEPLLTLGSRAVALTRSAITYAAFRRELCQRAASSEGHGPTCADVCATAMGGAKASGATLPENTLWRTTLASLRTLD